MAMSPPMIYQDLVLIGGGHAHAQVIKMWGMQPLPGVRLTLISPQVQTPYSGMLPGLIAGHYQFDETHIDLMRLCQYAGVRFIQANVQRIDLLKNDIILSPSTDQSNTSAVTERPPISFDLLSINSGITPDLTLAGAHEYATAVKPISAFYPRWQNTLRQLERANRDTSISVVGGGAAGIELILAMQHVINQSPDIHCKVTFNLVFRGEQLAANFPAALQKKIIQRLNSKGVTCHSRSDVLSIEKNKIIFTASKAPLHSEHIFLCTHAKAPQWPQQSGLATDKFGFIAITDTLQSSSHENVFAVGDIAQQTNHPRPHAGVFAVRQGPVLYKNLRQKLLGKTLQQHIPQQNFLSLLACGDQYALGYRRFWPDLAGAWVWRWKDRIDRRFMAMFSELNDKSIMMNNPDDAIDSAISGDETPKDLSVLAMRCGGCGAKVGATTLSRVISQLKPVKRDDVVLGLDSPDDAAAIRVNSNNTADKESLLIQSVDVFRAFMDEPYLLGQIAAEHALSDLFAMNAQPQSAMAIATLPFSGEKITERDLLQLMSGALKVLNQNNCELTGGHTSEGAELSIGFSVNGLAAETELLKKSSVEVDQVLILTQPLGTGTLFAAHGQLKAQGVWIADALNGMLLSNRTAGDIFHRFQATACTDVTGFGLLGHLVEMLKPSGLAAQLNMSVIPALEGALECLEKGIASSLQPQNIRLRRAIKNPAEWVASSLYQLLFDPQTSGGLLASIPRAQASQCLSELHTQGYPDAVIIGHVRDNKDTAEIIELVN